MGNVVKKFFTQNIYQLLIASITVVVALFSAFVGLQLFEQSTNLQLQAANQRLSTVEQTLYGKDGLQSEVGQLRTESEDTNRYVHQLVDHLLK